MNVENQYIFIKKVLKSNLYSTISNYIYNEKDKFPTKKIVFGGRVRNVFRIADWEKTIKPHLLKKSQAEFYRFLAAENNTPLNIIAAIDNHLNQNKEQNNEQFRR